MNDTLEGSRKPESPAHAMPGDDRTHALNSTRSGPTAPMAVAAWHLPVWLVTVALAAVPTAAVGAHADDSAPDGFWSPERKTLALNSGIVAGVTVYGFTVWDWGKAGFAFESEGWFGRDTASGGADKLGHAFTGAAATALPLPP